MSPIYHHSHSQAKFRYYIVASQPSLAIIFFHLVPMRLQVSATGIVDILKENDIAHEEMGGMCFMDSGLWFLYLSGCSIGMNLEDGGWRMAFLLLCFLILEAHLTV